MRHVVLALTVSLIFGCGERLGPERVATVPVRGTVFIAGKPQADVRVTLHAVEARNDGGRYTSQPSGISDENGEFVISTYEQGDGVAAGSYAVTFEWLTYNVMKNQWGGPDKLNGKYADPKTTPHKVTVTGEEEAIELEPFTLTAK